MANASRHSVAKVRFAAQLLDKTDFLMVQETHATPADFEMLGLELHGALSAHACLSNTAGGVATFIRAEVARHFPIISNTILAEGRVLAVHLSNENDHLHFINLHLEPQASLRTCKDRLGAVLAYANAHPGHSIIIGGDFNFPAAGEGRLNLENFDANVDFKSEI